MFFSVSGCVLSILKKKYKHFENDELNDGFISDFQRNPLLRN